MTILRNILAVILGLVVGGLVNVCMVTLGPHVIPPPAGADLTTVDGLKASMHLLEARHFVFPFLAHALGTFAGALVANLVAANHRFIFAMVIGVLTLAGGIAASLMIPAPVGFVILDLVVAYIPMALAANWLGKRIRP